MYLVELTLKKTVVCGTFSQTAQKKVTDMHVKTLHVLLYLTYYVS